MGPQMNFWLMLPFFFGLAAGQGYVDGRGKSCSTTTKVPEVLSCNTQQHTGYNLKNIACMCHGCNSVPIFYGCTAAQSRDKQTSTGCKQVGCGQCKPTGSSCTKSGTPCCDSFTGLGQELRVSGTCQKGTCGVCAFTGGFCSSGPVDQIQCCEAFSDPQTKVKCQRVGYDVWKCVENPCKDGDYEYFGNTCPGISHDFTFCKCPKRSEKRPSQCISGQCKKCGLTGASCSVSDDCCIPQPTFSSSDGIPQHSILVFAVKNPMKSECRKGKCAPCFGPYIEVKENSTLNNCGKSPDIPCCEDANGPYECLTDGGLVGCSED